MKKHSYDEYLKEQLKDPKFKKGYEKGVRNLQLGYQVFLAREAAGMTQMQLAAAIGTRQANISRMEMGDYNFTVEMLQRIARALRADLHIELSPPSDSKAA
ncbi:MAG TPA: helix-turn-helix transcriptional regulator [Candidatus Omnitrophota bacterium]|nr:helix-turn-helix transcriptional regulator [Candidatus Omnitrophota bacterium]